MLVFNAQNFPWIQKLFEQSNDLTGQWVLTGQLVLTTYTAPSVTHRILHGGEKRPPCSQRVITPKNLTPGNMADTC